MVNYQTRKIMNLRVKIIIFILFLFSFYFQFLSAQPLEFICYQLENGLKIYYQNDLQARYTTLLFVFYGGQGKDPAGKNGLSYLTARLLAEIADEDRLAELIAAGVNIKAGSNYDFSFVQFDFPTEKLEKVLRLAVANLNQPIFSTARIEGIKKAFISEIMLEKSRLFDSAVLGLKKKIFAGSPYSFSLFGDENNLKAISKKDISKFYQNLFKPDKFCLIVISDMEKEKIISFFKNYENDLKILSTKATPQETLSSAVSSAFNNSTGNTSLLYNCGYQGPPGTAVLLAYTFPNPIDKNYPLAYITQAIIGGYPGSILWNLRQENGISYNPQCYLEIIGGKLVFYVYLETDLQPASAALDGLREIFRCLGQNGLKNEEIETAKLMAKNLFQRQSFSRDYRLNQLALFLANNLPLEFYNQFCLKIDGIKPSDVNEFLHSIFKMPAIEVVISSN
jgi:predicted Zn-dependent peptidase